MQSRMTSKTRIWEKKFGKSEMRLLQKPCAMRGNSLKLNYIFPEIPQVDNAKCIVRDSIAKTVGKFVQESCDKSESKAVTASRRPV